MSYNVPGRHVLSRVHGDRQKARAVASKKIKDDFECADICQINFDAKLLPNLGGFGSVNRLAIVAVHRGVAAGGPGGRAPLTKGLAPPEEI